jgi:hypothetical protein
MQETLIEFQRERQEGKISVSLLQAPLEPVCQLRAWHGSVFVILRTTCNEAAPSYWDEDSIQLPSSQIG